MTLGCLIFGLLNLGRGEIQGKRVLEVGSLDVSGSLRPIVEFYNPREYIGVDIVSGRGVDLICDARDLIAAFGPDSFDLVLSTEMLEHVHHWKDAIHNLKAVTRPGGTILVTTRSEGFPYHGYPHDYWRFAPGDMEIIFSDCAIDKISRDPQKGVLVKAVKPWGFLQNDLSGLEIYSILTRTKLKDIGEATVGDLLPGQSIAAAPKGMYARRHRSLALMALVRALRVYKRILSWRRRPS